MAELPNGSGVSDSDPSHYFGQLQTVLTLEKATNGQDADLPPGPVLAVGAPVAWIYTVTNLGAEEVTDVAVTDEARLSRLASQRSADQPISRPRARSS